MIKQAAKDFWNWLSTEGWPAFCNWIQNTVWPAIKDIAKKFWEWLTTVALPKLGEFLKSLPGKLGNWVKTDGVRMVGDALKGLMDKAAEIKDHIIEWAKGIHGHIAEGLGRVKDRILEKGSEIASGIAEGLVRGITEFPSKVAQFGSNVVDAIKNFFGINSPSKLMRDEVGVYLSQGVAEGILGAIPDTTSAMTTLGDSVMAAAQSSMGDLSHFGSIDTPTISPVLDMSSYNSGMSQVRDFGNTNSITGTLELTSNRLNQGLQSNQRGITALGDGIVEVGDGIVEVSDDVVELDGSMNEISGYLGKTNDSIKVMDNNVVSMSNQTASATANMTDAVVSNLQTVNKSIKDVGNSVDSIDRNLSAFWNKYLWLSGCIEDIQLYTYKTYTDLQEGKLNMYVDSGELVGAIASDMDQALGYRQVGTQRGMY
jgi:phage-related protein